ncbi:MAG: hypothetical protein LH702_33100, partial [Phormidesmis sp. CAN_BIN44]|nr:hypothetical protein [Phormidesmis sp. CAN_BIN44]
LESDPSELAKQSLSFELEKLRFSTRQIRAAIAMDISPQSPMPAQPRLASLHLLGVAECKDEFPSSRSGAKP